MNKFGFAVVAAVTALTAPASAANLIVDGGFDAGVGTAFGSAWYIVSYPGQTEPNSALRADGQAYINNAGASGSPAAAANHFATFGAGDSSNVVLLLQNFTVGAGTYVVTFDAGAFGGEQVITTGIFDFGPFAYIPGTELSFTPTTPTTNLDAIFQPYSFKFSTAGGNLAIGFTAYQSSTTASRDALVDNVAINAVPEPATWAMMIGGFAFAGAAMRRKKAVISFA